MKKLAIYPVLLLLLLIVPVLTVCLCNAQVCWNESCSREEILNLIPDEAFKEKIKVRLPDSNSIRFKFCTDREKNSGLLECLENILFSDDLTKLKKLLGVENGTILSSVERHGFTSIALVSKLKLKGKLSEKMEKCIEKGAYCRDAVSGIRELIQNQDFCPENSREYYLCLQLLGEFFLSINRTNDSKDPFKESCNNGKFPGSSTSCYYYAELVDKKGICEKYMNNCEKLCLKEKKQESTSPKNSEKEKQDVSSENEEIFTCNNCNNKDAKEKICGEK